MSEIQRYDIQVSYPRNDDPIWEAFPWLGIPGTIGQGEWVKFSDLASYVEQKVKEAVEKERAKLFPNPLQLSVNSRILVSSFKDADGACGVLFRDTGRDHSTGELYPQEALHIPHEPQPGELYLRFTTHQSAVVVLEALTQAICDLMGFPDRTKADASIESKLTESEKKETP